MWACLSKTCPCLPFQSSKSPIGHYSYDDDDENREFESLLAGQNSENLAAFLSRSPFQRSANSQEYQYLRIDDMVTPNEETSTEHVDNLLDEDNLQTQDAQFLPDEQINKLISEQARYDQITDAQLAAEEEEARRLEEEDYEIKRRAATEAALAKGMITPEQANNKNKFFSIDDDDDDDDDDGVTDSSRTVYSMNLDGGSSVELAATASQRNAPIYEEEQNASSLNKPRNPHERFVASEVNEEDYDDVTDFEDPPPTNSKDQTTIDDPLTRCSVAAQDEA